MNNKLAKTMTPKQLLLPLTVEADAVLLLKIIVLTRSYRLTPGSSRKRFRSGKRQNMLIGALSTGCTQVSVATK